MNPRFWRAALLILGLVMSAMTSDSRSIALAQTGPADGTPFPLWPDGPPGVAKDAPGLRPTLTLYRPSPEKATGAVVVVCPGGGYGGHADHEGRPIAEWLNGLGVVGRGPEVPARPPLAPPGHARGRGPSDPDSPGQRRRLEGRPEAGRRPRLLGGRAPGLDHRHPLRRRQPRRQGPDRPAQLPARIGRS